MTAIPSVLTRSLTDFVEGLAVAIPRLLSGLVFLALAYVTVRVVLSLVRTSIERMYVGDRELVGDLIVTLVSIFLWFGVALTFLKVLGMGDIAASLGTAVGFIALGVSYALSEMIEDTVAGVYLLRDPDFNVGYRVEAKGMTGTVAAIELRKTRIDADNGDRVVVANREIEPRWTHDVPEAEPADEGPSTAD
ncbi:mechanosensitive ion channel domain-containing protein [Halorubrum sp. 2020YC2]|uniref:mechanosensitive ion channel domain-containing protein n=1 Tax=Halorubrum sp. 2020YC2 TaxID=2836432 RepID=UPI001BE65665|nr:mechanosensitive ion channel domain-containing protein [Halorubrum sp. 2020YC2]QWC18258.1 mechanosensitive ion channel family protein [Halorubrum sp. 2020YC2]